MEPANYIDDLISKNQSKVHSKIEIIFYTDYLENCVRKN